MIGKALLSSGLVAGSLFLGAATATASPTAPSDPSDPNSNPFAGLTASGQQAAPDANGPARVGDVERGLRQGLAH